MQELLKAFKRQAQHFTISFTHMHVLSEEKLHEEKPCMQSLASSSLLFQ